MDGWPKERETYRRRVLVFLVIKISQKNYVEVTTLSTNALLNLGNLTYKHVKKGTGAASDIHTVIGEICQNNTKWSV